MIGLQQSLPVVGVKGKHSKCSDQGSRSASWQAYSFTPGRASRPFFTRIAVAGAGHKVHSLAQPTTIMLHDDSESMRKGSNITCPTTAGQTYRGVFPVADDGRVQIAIT